ncbi:MAG: hypothetical protein CBC13_03345 [Planctomycetia bacterium TMED53]|nr:MAG: hypothetical protein CBC13_03345 [Planctomycetia bacterium TMED53]
MKSTSDLFQLENTPTGVISSAFPIGVAIAVAMWTSGFIARLPFVQAAPSLLFAVLAIIVILGGRSAARSHPQRWLATVIATSVAAVFDLLVIGAFLAEDLSDGVRSGIALGSFFTGMTILGLIGAATVQPVPQPRTKIEGMELMGAATFLATLVMIAIGGLVTSEEAGMAVPDWPASFGENMFLLPLSRMTGGIYYEHAHRLYGTLVGLVTISMTVYMFRLGAPRILRWGAVLATFQVIFQGVLGGLRVTEVESVTEVAGQVTAWEESAWSLALRVFHGVDGQLFLALTAAIWLLSSRLWNRQLEGQVPRVDRTWTLILLFGLISQLVMGAMSRHVSREWMIPHIIGAFVVLGLVMVVGARCTLPGMPTPRVRSGLILGIVAAIQVTLGFYALAVTGTEVRSASSGVHETLVATLHQTLGAVLLSVASVLACWTYRPWEATDIGHLGGDIPEEKTS